MTKLNVPYFSQRDNYRDSWRTCFSSSCAMLLKFLKPESISGDDDYIRRVFRNGDTTNSGVQLNTLSQYGVRGRFVSNLNNDTLKQQIDLGFPVPVGILHKGSAWNPSGGGHWLVVIGYDETGWIVNDPWGEINHSTGEYLSTNGESVKYSYDLMDSRWTVTGSSDGWAILVDSFTS